MRVAAFVLLGMLAGCASAPRETVVEPAQAADFKAKTDGSEIVYCKNTPTLGSRFPTEVCMTEAELRQHMAANDAMRRDKDQSSRLCSSGCPIP